MVRKKSSPKAIEKQSKNNPLRHGLEALILAFRWYVSLHSTRWEKQAIIIVIRYAYILDHLSLPYQSSSSVNEDTFKQKKELTP